ncbi:MAG: alpha,alpha-trehalase [Bacteroidales bacterium]|nr:alpha,alpha-trehalase [Bacteroidales bacterium]
MRNRFLIVLVLILAVCSCERSLDTKVRRHISAGWEKTLRVNTADTPDSLIGMPRPYTVPCPDGTFQELYYWDTYFTNEGLIADGHVEMAKDNAEDILFLIDRYGFMPNGSRLWYLSRSQPPFAAAMVMSVFNATGDTLWLRGAYPTLKREYEFWQGKRQTPLGLNRYGGEADDKLIQEFIGTAGKRLGTDFRAKGWTEEELVRFGQHCVAECESGWDFNPRFNRRCEDYCPVDLNAILYGVETSMAGFSRILGTGEEALWLERAVLRKERIVSYCFRDGAFYDYDWVNSEPSAVLSAAQFALLYFGAADTVHAESVRNTLTRLEYPAGISVCADSPYDYVYQWSFPNTWPPVVYMAVMGLDRYGYRDDARRIASNWKTATERLYAKTGKLWEKMTCNTGSVPDGTEYGTPSMMGWTAGVYVCLDEFLKHE